MIHQMLSKFTSTNAILTLLILSLIAVLTIFQRAPSCPKPIQFTQLKTVVASDSTSVSLCYTNPYLRSLRENPSDVLTRMDVWLENIGQHAANVDSTSMTRKNHDRFFPFNAMATCSDKACVGGFCGSDESKIVCGLDHLKTNQRIRSLWKADQRTTESCIVYSIGGNNQWKFELDVLRRTSCTVHTFDCTGEIQRFQVPSTGTKQNRINFHHVCLGTVHESAPTTCSGKNKCGETWTLLEMQQKLGHTRIDLFKMDIEGYEWPLLESWPTLADAASSSMILPMQIVTEIHYRTHFPSLRPPSISHDRDLYHLRDILNLEAHFLRMGYIVVARDDNIHCFHCTELTLMRVKCHNVDEPK